LDAEEEEEEIVVVLVFSCVDSRDCAKAKVLARHIKEIDKINVRKLELIENLINHIFQSRQIGLKLYLKYFSIIKSVFMASILTK